MKAKETCAEHSEPAEFTPEWFDMCQEAWRANKIRDGQSWKYKRQKKKSEENLEETSEQPKIPRRSARLAALRIKNCIDRLKADQLNFNAALAH